MTETRLILGLARREARERVRSKAFRISTVILLLAAGAAVVLPNLLGIDEETTHRVGLAAGVAGGLEQAIASSTPDGMSLETIQLADGTAVDATLTGDDADLDVVMTGTPELVWADDPDAALESVLRGAVTQVAIAERAEQLGVAPADVGALFAPVDLPSTRAGDAAPPEADDQRAPQAIIATAGMVLLFVSITFYGSYILLSVIEEKQNRVVEVLLAHVEPRDLLAAKVLGHGALGLAQFLAIALVVTVGLSMTTAFEVPAGAYGAIAATVMWFLLGYSFYSILYGALGSLASRTEDAQSAVGPLTMVLMLAYFVSFTTISNPDGLVAVIGSFLPPTAPLMMPIRTALTDVPLWQPLLAVAIELAAIVGLVHLGGRLYRGAVLRLGRKVSLREAWHATG
jgi:ABC-2 type transport system permease protein